MFSFPVTQFRPCSFLALSFGPRLHSKVRRLFFRIEMLTAQPRFARTDKRPDVGDQRNTFFRARIHLGHQFAC